MSLEDRQKEFERFCAERQWLAFHSPKNLAMALAGEVGELVALFQWTDCARSMELMEEPDRAELVREELADVTLYLLRLAQVLRVDLDDAVGDKLLKNAHRFPIVG